MGRPATRKRSEAPAFVVSVKNAVFSFQCGMYILIKSFFLFAGEILVNGTGNFQQNIIGFVNPANIFYVYANPCVIDVSGIADFQLGGNPLGAEHGSRGSAKMRRNFPRKARRGYLRYIRYSLKKINSFVV